MNKSELVEQVADRAGLARCQAAGAIDAALTAIEAELAAGGDIRHGGPCPRAGRDHRTVGGVMTEGAHRTPLALAARAARPREAFHRAAWSATLEHTRIVLLDLRAEVDARTA